MTTTNPDESKERIERATIEITDELAQRAEDLFSELPDGIWTVRAMALFAAADNHLLSTRVEKLEQACKKALTCASLNSDVRNFIQSVLTEKRM